MDTAVLPSGVKRPAREVGHTSIECSGHVRVDLYLCSRYVPPWRGQELSLRVCYKFLGQNRRFALRIDSDVRDGVIGAK
jgi:hypothetical protein